MYLNNQKNIEWGLGVSTGNLFVKREVFDQFGLFDMESVSGNDILFTEKAIKSGYTLAYGPDVIVSYPAKSFKELKKDVFKYGVGAFMTNQKRLGHSLRFLLPMTFRNFQGAVRFRNFNLTLSEYFIAWILVWRIKFQFALGILSGAMKK